jgi:RHS repeat-associated protein
LTDPAGDNPKARVSYVASWPDPLGRTVVAANYGTNHASALVRPAVFPAPSDTVLLTTTAYDDRGEVWLTTDPASTVTKSIFDDAGRIIAKIEDFSISSGHANRETDYTYNADGKVVTLKTVNSTTGNQITTYYYGTTLSTSDLASNDLLAAISYPDSTGTSDRVTFAYNRQGQTKMQTDQLGTAHTLEYDLLGRSIHDRVTTLGSGVDGGILRISTTYEARGMVLNVTSYNNATVGSGSVVNDVQHVYNSFSQLVTQYQSHSGAVNTGLTPSVQYGYADGSANTIRPTSITYPNGRVISWDYGAARAMNDQLSRIGSLIDSDVGATHLVDYTYVGLNRTVQVDSVQPGTALTYIKQGSEPIGDGGDQYTGWDRFTRVVDQRWILTSTIVDLERIQYGFDRVGNRLYHANMVASGGQDEYYAYDRLSQLLRLQRGTLNTGRSGISGTPVREEDFAFDPTGNWNTYATKVMGVTVLNQGRTHNPANEITAIDGSSVYIAENEVGNIVIAPLTGNWLAATELVYDAWNRLISVSQGVGISSGSSSGGAGTITEYAYDGLKRRVSKTTSATRHFYYSPSWQIMEERTGSSASADKQLVWGLRYLDDLVLRDRGSERFYGLHDYFSCTAIVDTSGTVQERYGYNAFGHSRVMDADFNLRTASLYDWETRYAAYRWDGETGFYQVRNRYLHPTLGRWLTRDPLGYADGVNLYVYCNNQSPNSIDAQGLLKVTRIGEPTVTMCEEAIGKYTFTLDNPAPCRGYMVLKNEIYSSIDLTCKNCPSKADTLTKVFYEAFPVTEGNKLSDVHNTLGYSDQAVVALIGSAKTQSCGYSKIVGTIKFFCKNDKTGNLGNWPEDNGTLAPGWLDPAAQTNPPTVVAYTNDKPTWWDDFSSETATRGLEVTWCCHCPDKPKDTFNVIQSPPT